MADNEVGWTISHPPRKRANPAKASYALLFGDEFQVSEDQLRRYPN
jgi:hypothetical protein